MHSPSGSNILVGPKFHISTHNSVKQFCENLVFDASTVWNALSNQTRVCHSVSSFRKKAEVCIYTKTYPNLVLIPPWYSPLSFTNFIHQGKFSAINLNWNYNRL